MDMIQVGHYEWWYGLWSSKANPGGADIRSMADLTRYIKVRLVGMSP